MRKLVSKTLKQIALGGALAAIATSGFAANQGTPGFTSTGDLLITLDVAEEMQISSLIDMPFGTFAGADQTLTSPACIYRSGGSQLYDITATGSGVGGAFVISGGGFTIPYAVDYTDDNTNTNAMAPGTPWGGTGTDTDAACANTGDNGSIDVTITAANASAVPQGAYAGTLTLLVAPR